MRTFLTILIIVAVGLGASSAEGDERHYVTGLMLESETYDLCHYDCAPFDRPTFFFCVQADDQILVGSHKADWKWQYDSSQMLRFAGKQVSVRYDNRSIWMIRTDGKDMHLERDYSQDIFRNTRCTAEIHKRMLKGLGDVTKPTSVPGNAVLIPEGGRRFFWHYYSWVACSFDAPENDDICTYWDKSGKLSYEDHVVGDRDRKPVPDADLQIDPYGSKRLEIHLRNGLSLISDGRARINGKFATNLPKP